VDYIRASGIWSKRKTVAGSERKAFNRANARLTLFQKDGDYLAFHRVLAEACEQVPMVEVHLQSIVELAPRQMKIVSRIPG
jgi:hypothetical protein